MINNELWRKCFGSCNVPMLKTASRLALETYTIFLQKELQKITSERSEICPDCDGGVIALGSMMERNCTKCKGTGRL